MQLRETTAFISINNLKHNLGQIRRRLVPGEFLCPMIKADAYGHGDVTVAKALIEEGVERLGVCLIEEGLRLRKAGVKVPILVYSPFSDDSSGYEMLNAKLTPVISSPAQLDLMGELGEGGLSVHLEFDTGMNRLGFSPAEAAKVAARLDDFPGLQLDGIMTHLHSGDDAAQVDEQLARFAPVVRAFQARKPIVHALNSAGIFRRAVLGASAKTDWVGARPGLCLYGLRPFHEPETDCLKPVMSFRAPIVQVRKVPKGGTVSYGATWSAHRESLIGIVAAGYGDGVPRHLSNKGQVLCKGQLIPIVGIVCMDYFMVDLTDLNDPTGGDQLVGVETTLFGESSEGALVRAETVAACAGSINYELTTRISPRVPRVPVNKMEKGS